jgi:uncharacterized protein (DUF488 family)
MTTAEFRAAADELLNAGQPRPAAMMCAEGLFWRCHRRLVSDYLLMQGVTVQHIMPSGELRPHTLTNGAVIDRDAVTYPPLPHSQARLLFE